MVGFVLCFWGQNYVTRLLGVIVRQTTALQKQFRCTGTRYGSALAASADIVAQAFWQGPDLSVFPDAQEVRPLFVAVKSTVASRPWDAFADDNFKVYVPADERGPGCLTERAQKPETEGAVIGAQRVQTGRGQSVSHLCVFLSAQNVSWGCTLYRIRPEDRDSHSDKRTERPETAQPCVAANACHAMRRHAMAYHALPRPGGIARAQTASQVGKARLPIRNPAAGPNKVSQAVCYPENAVRWPCALPLASAPESGEATTKKAPSDSDSGAAKWSQMNAGSCQANNPWGA